MLGKSSRFYEAGFDIPKYKLDIHGESLFCRVINSFSKYFDNDKFIFLIRSDFEDREWIELNLRNMKLKDFSIIVSDQNTSGQAESVFLATKNYSDDNEELYIFNIDTILKNFSKLEISSDAYLETFEGAGDHWSFAEVDQEDNVLRTSEKERISPNCSNGLYYFKSVHIFNNYFKKYINSIDGESYIAPMYNLLVADNLNVKIKRIDSADILLCGTPEEYKKLICSKL